MVRYAITGGIGSGKSYVCRILEQVFATTVYDCDTAAKRLMRTDKTLQCRLSEVVGQNVFPDGVLDKNLLRAFLLASEDNNRIVNSIVHPVVADDFMTSGLQFMESAILFEADFQRYVDRVICVSAPLDVRVERVMQRDGITREKALEWINRQMPQDEKEHLSDFVVVNDGRATADDIAETIKQIITLQ